MTSSHSSTTIDRIGCVALMIAGPLCLLGGLLHPVVDGKAHDVAALSTDHTLGSWALLIGTVALLLGLPFVYRVLADRLGVLGVVGFLGYFLGNLLAAFPHLILMAFVADDLLKHHPESISDDDLIVSGPMFAVEQTVTGLLFIVGLLVLGIACVRARDHRALRVLGGIGVLAAFVTLVPVPLTAIVSGLQFELLRAVFGVGLAVVAFRTVAGRSLPVTPASRTPRADVVLG